MKILKKIILFAAVGVAFSSPLVYGENNTEVKAAIDQTVAKLEETAAAVDKGEDAKALADMVMEAKQIQKSISTSDPKVTIKKNQGSNKLGKARTSFNDGDMKQGGELVKEALADYKEVKEKYDASH
jgi:2,3-bisphosphoglycerate-independent phosphoglycerate mutase